MVQMQVTRKHVISFAFAIAMVVATNAQVDDPNDPEHMLNNFIVDNYGSYQTTNQGVRVNDTDSLKAGIRGPTLIEDNVFREKLNHFDFERIPERVVHARGAGAHGYFQSYADWSNITMANFLSSPSLKTPVYVRFSTVAGFRGSVDTPRDARGFATKFYTKEGNFDIVGIDFAPFFIQDAIKFPDLIHAVKPEADWEIPQAASAHETFYDFCSLSPESMHALMWLNSARGIPRSFRLMEGFGVHTFRFVNSMGIAKFIKWHWKPTYGLESNAWDESQMINGRDGDFQRRDLWNSIVNGYYPEYELAVQIVDESDQFKYGFDILDPTKLIPEEMVPITKLGKMVLNRNPDNYFAETEQIALHPGNLVRGIDVSDDPLLQGRLFSYLDTQVHRLGSNNFAEIPINRPLASVNNTQRDGTMAGTIPKGKANYYPNSLGDGYPQMATPETGEYVSYPEPLTGRIVRGKSPSFFDFYSQPAMFYHSQNIYEQQHIVDSFRFELSNVQSTIVRQRVIDQLNYIDFDLARRVAYYIGAEMPTKFMGTPSNMTSPSLSISNYPKTTIRGRTVAILVVDGVNIAEVTPVMDALMAKGVLVTIISGKLGPVKVTGGSGSLMANATYGTTDSVLFDAVYVPGGEKSVMALTSPFPGIPYGMPIAFLRSAYRHFKAIAVSYEAVDLLKMAEVPYGNCGDLCAGVFTGNNTDSASTLGMDLVTALWNGRFVQRTVLDPPSLYKL